MAFFILTRFVLVKYSRAFVEASSLASRLTTVSLNIAAIHNSYKTILASFNFGRRTKNRQTAKLKSPPNKLRIWYIMW